MIVRQGLLSGTRVRRAMNDLICSSHTVSGVLPGAPVVSRHSFDRRVEAVAEAGYRGMFIHIRDYARERQGGRSDAEFGRVLRASGIEPAGIEFLTDWFLAGAAARTCEDLAFAAAQACGARIINIGPDLHGHGISLTTMRERFAALCDRAARHGVSIALEIVAWGNVRDVATALWLIDGISNAGLVIDSWHVFRGGIGLHELAAIPPERILCVQINDAGPETIGPLPQDTLHRRLCGDGIFDLTGFARVLRAMGSAVPFSVEIISRSQAERSLAEAATLSFETARKALFAERRACSSPDRMSRDGVRSGAARTEGRK